MFRVMSLHQLTQAMVAKTLLLDREVELTQVLPFNKAIEVAKTLPLDGRLPVAREPYLNVEEKVFTEPRRGDKRSKEATQLHNTALPCSIVHCRVP